MKKTLLIILALVLGMTAIAYSAETQQTKPTSSIVDPDPPQGQEVIVKGRVVDENGDPVMGVSIIEKGTSNGTTTDLEGKFSIRCHMNCTLEFSYIGMMPAEIKVTSLEINIIMRLDSELLMM